MEEGFIPIWRSIMEQPWYTRPNTAHLFVHILMQCCFRQRQIFYRGKVKVLEVGQYWTTRERLSSETGLSEQEVRTAIDHLKSTSTATSESSSQGTIITLLNRKKWMEATKTPTNDQPTINQRRNKERTYNNVKESISEATGEAEIIQIGPVERVFDAYLKSWNRNPKTYKLTPQRKDWIEEAIADKGVDLCIEGVKNFRADDYDRRSEFSGLEYLFGGTVEKRQQRRDRFCRTKDFRDSPGFRRSEASHRNNAAVFEAAMEISKANMEAKNAGNKRAGQDTPGTQMALGIKSVQPDGPAD